MPDVIYVIEYTREEKIHFEVALTDTLLKGERVDVEFLARTATAEWVRSGRAPQGYGYHREVGEWQENVVGVIRDA